MSDRLSNSGVIGLANLASDPVDGRNGDIYYNTALNTVRAYANGVWDDVQVGSVAGANNSLSNLTTTSINTDLLSSGNLTRNLGSPVNNWLRTYTNYLTSPSGVDAYNITTGLFLDGTSINSVNINSRTLYDNTGVDAINFADPSFISVNNRLLSNVSDPIVGSDAATKSYVDLLLQGIAWKMPADAATTADITLSGEQTIDGYLTSTSRVLVKDQSDPIENGVYLTGAGAWTRTPDANTSIELQSAAIFVSRGTANADKAWVQTADDVIVGTDPITWVQFTSVSAGANTTLSNLTAPIAINQDLSPDADMTRSIGIDVTKRFLEIRGYLMRGNTVTGTNYIEAGDPDHVGNYIKLNPNGSFEQLSNNYSFNSGNLSGIANLTVDNLFLDGNTISSTDTNGNVVISPNGTGYIDVATSLVKNGVDPVDPQDLATKAYVDSSSGGVSAWKAPVSIATIVGVTLSGEQTIDGVLTSASRILVKNQGTQSENGIYVTAAGAWARSTDADSASELEGAIVVVQRGSTNSGTIWKQETDGITLGSSNIVWATLPTKISNNILPLIASTTDLGSASLNFLNVHAQFINAAQILAAAEIANATTPTGVTANSLRNNSGATHLAMYTRNDGVNNGIQTGNVLIESGNKTGATGDSGSIIARTGTSVGGLRGTFNIHERSIGAASVGYVWTLQNTTTGEGAWIAPSGGSSEPTVEYRTISSGEDAAEELTLAGTPATPSKVILDVITGSSQEYGVDYSVTGNVLSWDGLGLDGVLTTGNKVRIIYWT